jgi:hypothetical protein
MYRIAGIVLASSLASLAAGGSIPFDEAPKEVERRSHWSFVAPARPAIPLVKDASWPRNAIDHFILARLEHEGLYPSPEADKTTLIRRVTLDLTGLPPTPAEVDDFLADGSPNAYEKLVDRLLTSPRFGERMAVPWLYAARYADTSGYQNDGPRFMWRWRDWVIDAFNQNQPFDKFTIEQIAGDLLPGATLPQQIATGFNRNHRSNAEGGIIPEEYAVEYVVDRVETTATVFLGVTLGCARCHDHKYDPFTQKDFYRVFAYFNNVPEFGRAIKEGNSPPYVQAPTAEDQERLRLLDREIDEAERQYATEQPQLAAAQAEWQSSFDTSRPIDWSTTDGLIAYLAFHGNLELSGPTTTPQFRNGGPAFVSGVVGEAVDLDGSRFVDAGDVASFGYFDKFSFGAWIYPNTDSGGTIISRMTDTEQGDGYSLELVRGKLQVNLVKRWLDDAIRVETEHHIEPDQWHHVFVTYNGSRQARGITIYVNGHAEKLRVNLDFINQTFTTKEPLRIGGGGGPDRRFRGRIDELRVYNRCLGADEVATIATPDSINQLVAVPAGRRSPQQANKLAAYFLEHHAPDVIRQSHKRLVSLRRMKERLIENLPTVMVMQELPTPRDTFVLLRGVYDKYGERVTPGVPAALPPLPDSAPDNRLGLARWLVDRNNPLTARVAVNRFWQMYFGTGLVKTTEDFGLQGDPPSHAELLDWLATEFGGPSANSWDVKSLQKLIVTSATYRQSSKTSSALRARDPENRLLARGPRLRLPAEAIRDQVLAVSGLLVEQRGGPSVKPYQPAGLWKELATDGEYVQDHGERLYRRSLYTYWKRTVAPPSMTTFDATAREACTVRETRTNTPLQALTLMNEVSFVEASRALAQRAMSDAGHEAEERIRFAFRLATARWPRPHELQILLSGLKEHIARFRAHPQAALELVRTGESPWNQQLDSAELAAYTTVASLILNLDEVVTKQ